MSFLFLNVEFLFLLNICLLIIFILSSNLFSSFRYLLELKSLRVDYLVRNLVNFSVFFFFTLINLLF
jgi:hypothetical protein